LFNYELKITNYDIKKVGKKWDFVSPSPSLFKRGRGFQSIFIITLPRSDATASERKIYIYF